MKQWKEYLYVRAGGYELSQSDNRLHLRNWYEHSENTYRRGARWSPAVPAKSNTVGGHSICPRCMEMNLNNRRRTPEPALCKGRCRAERGGGVVPDINYLLFLFANSALLQSLRRSRASPLYTRGPLGLCGHPPGTSTDIKAKNKSHRNGGFCFRIIYTCVCAPLRISSSALRSAFRNALSCEVRQGHRNGRTGA